MTEDPLAASPASPGGVEVIRMAFGERNRARLLDEYFGTQPEVSSTTAWRHVYRLLLSIDRTIGLVHCYESDKCQPGRPWYARALAVHDWVAQQFECSPVALAKEIDWLFRRATIDLASLAVAAGYTVRAQEQRRPYEGRGFPEAGEDPELTAIIFDTLGQWLTAEPPRDVQRQLVERVMAYVGQENKRKNLVGEGFEDTIAAVLRRIPGIERAYEVYTRKFLRDIPGFRPGRPNEKPRQVDLALIRRRDGQRILITAKWSVRADREEQFMTDFRDYSDLEDAGNDFDYVLITNEFDAARLVRACERRRQNALLFTDVVHVQPAGPALAYLDVGRDSRQKAGAMFGHIESGRLASLEAWITKLAATA